MIHSINYTVNIARCRVFLFRIEENVIFQNWMSRRALAKGGNHGWLPRWKRIDLSAKSIPLVRMSSISFTSVMFAGVIVLYSILSLILLMRVMIFCVEMYFYSIVLYIRTESIFLVVTSSEDGMITGLNGSRRNNLSWISRYISRWLDDDKKLNDAIAHLVWSYLFYLCWNKNIFF